MQAIAILAALAAPSMARRQLQNSDEFIVGQTRSLMQAGYGYGYGEETTPVVVDAVAPEPDTGDAVMAAPVPEPKKPEVMAAPADEPEDDSGDAVLADTPVRTGPPGQSTQLPGCFLDHINEGSPGCEQCLDGYFKIATDDDELNFCQPCDEMVNCAVCSDYSGCSQCADDSAPMIKSFKAVNGMTVDGLTVCG